MLFAQALESIAIKLACPCQQISRGSLSDKLRNGHVYSGTQPSQKCAHKNQVTSRLSQRPWRDRC